MVRLSTLLLALLIAGCPAPAATTTTTTTTPTRPTTPEQIEPPKLSWTRVVTRDDVPPAPAPGTYQVHLIDVGTGLAVRVRGADFSLLYDAGTNDAGEKPMRVLAYLAAALGPSGDDLCVEPGAPVPTERRALPHVVLSHPHLDHASALDLVFHCYDVGDFWEPGRVVARVFYRELLEVVGKSRARRHTALEFSEGDVVPLGETARFTILHANAKPASDPNENSLVIAVELGRTRLLLVGDAESGPRKDPTYPPGDVEAHLIDHHASRIRADVLQVGHHGSKTSSRRAFLEAVAPRVALISSGPKSYGGTTLPDVEVLDELARIGAIVLRTDTHDQSCPERGRLGGDRGPGGCDSWVITIGP